MYDKIRTLQFPSQRSTNYTLKLLPFILCSKKKQKINFTRCPSHTCLKILNSKSRSFTTLTPAIVLMKSI